MADLKIPVENNFSTVTKALNHVIKVCETLLKLKSNNYGKILIEYMQIPLKIEKYKDFIKNLKVTKNPSQRVELYKYIQTVLNTDNNVSFATFSQGPTRLVMPLKEVGEALKKAESTSINKEDIEKKKDKFIDKILKSSDGDILKLFEHEDLMHKHKVEEMVRYFESIAKVFDSTIPTIRDATMEIVKQKANREIKENTSSLEVSDNIKNSLIDTYYQMLVNGFEKGFWGSRQRETFDARCEIKKKYKEYTEEKKKLQQEIVTLNLDYKKTNSDLKNKKSELKKLQSKIIKTSSTKKKIQNIESKIKDLQNECEEAKNKYQELYKELNQEKSDHNKDVNKKKSKAYLDLYNKLDIKIREYKKLENDFTVKFSKLASDNNVDQATQKECIKKGLEKFNRDENKLKEKLETDYNKNLKAIDNIK